MGVAIVLLAGCDCGPQPSSQREQSFDAFDAIMKDHAALSVAARNALILGDLPSARHAMRKLAFFMEHVPAPAQGKEYARITQELALEARDAADLEQACMAFGRLSYACGQCHHALDRGPPMKLDPAPAGEDVRQHMRRHAWAVERMWEALLSDSTLAFQDAAESLAEAPLHGPNKPDRESPEGATRLAYEVHDLAFAAAVEGKVREEEYVPRRGESTEDSPTSRGQAEIYGRLLHACSRCHGLLGVTPELETTQTRWEVSP